MTFQSISQSIAQAFKNLRWFEWCMFAIMAIIGAWAMITDTTHPNWYLITNFICALAGLGCIFLTAHASWPNFLFGIVNTVLYCVVLWYNKVYGTLALEIFYYLPFQFVAIMAWRKNLQDEASDRCRARRLNLWQILAMLAFLGASTWGCHWILVEIGGATAWLDAMIVSIGLLAMVYNCKRFGDQYILWIITDVIAVVQWMSLDDPIMFTKKFIYLVMAVIGLIRWRKLSVRYNQENV